MKKLSNSVQLIGRLGSDPEIKTVKGNLKVARMRLATSEVYYNKAGEKIEETQWHTLIAWKNLAEFSEKYLKKGQEIAVEGKLSYQSYVDKNNNKQFTTVININEMLMVGNRKAG